ncbi:MAG: twin-arginine translocase subunit TatC [bacterium]|nr:twin-arginine translocase subunit TatC [bacterium]
MTDEREEEHFEEKPFLAHLEDLRMTLFKIIAATLAGAVVCFVLSTKIFSILKAPVRRHATIVSDESVTPPQEKKPPSPDATEDKRPAPIIVTGPLGGLVMLARDLVTYSRETLSFLRRHARDLESPHTESSQKKGPKPPYQSKGKRPAVEKEKARPVVKFIETGPAKGFVVVFKTSFLVGVGLTLPLSLFFLAQFVFPALTRKEKSYVTPSFLIGGGLFAVGVLFGYFITLPLGIKIFLDWNHRYGIANDWRVSEYLSLATKLLIANGVMFEMPLILTILVRLGVLSVAALRRKRKHAIVIILFVAAILTPTVDGLTMMIVAAPMIVMYEACIWVSYLLMRKKARREKEEERKETYWEERKRIKRAAKIEHEKKEEKAKPTEKAAESEGPGSPPQDASEDRQHDDQSGQEKKPEEEGHTQYDFGSGTQPPGPEEKSDWSDEKPYREDN